MITEVNTITVDSMFRQNIRKTVTTLKVLKQIIPKEDFQNIELSLKKKDYFELVRSLIVYHYDKAYKKTRAENHSNIFKEIELKKINLTNIKKVIALNNFR